MTSTPAQFYVSRHYLNDMMQREAVPVHTPGNGHHRSSLSGTLRLRISRIVRHGRRPWQQASPDYSETVAMSHRGTGVEGSRLRFHSGPERRTSLDEY